MMKVKTLFLWSLFLQVTTARELGVRILLNEGEENGSVCSVNEFDIVAQALKKQARKSNSFDLANTAGRRKLVTNCGHICCGFPFGLCGIYQPACAGYPTVSSNNQYCRRRDLEDGEPNQSIILVDGVAPENRSQRDLQEDLQEAEHCRQLKKEALIAIASILDRLDDACADVALLPTRYQCYVAFDS